MKRRALIQSMGTATALGISGVMLPSLARAQDRYAKYRGQTLVINIPAHPHYDAMLKLLPEFTRETGIKVEVDKLAMARLKDKQLLEMSKPQGDYDMISYVVMWKSEYVKKNLLRPLEPFFKNTTLADPQYDRADLVPRYVENIGLVGGPKGYLPGPGAQLYGLPYGAETSILAYRRDIFEKTGLKPPATYAELEQLLPVLKEKAGMGAMTSRGQAGHQCVHAWLLHLNPLGGHIFDDHWKPRFNDAVGVKALNLLKLISDTGPVGIPGYGQGEMITSFLQGQSAMYLDSSLIFGQVNDASKSRISGKVSYLLHPKGVRYSSQSGGLGLAIPRNARNADAAFLLMQWLTSKAQDKAVCRLGGVPSRMSTMMDRDMVRMYPEYIMLAEQIRYSDPDWRPIIAEWDEINIQALGVAISEALTGKKGAAEALNGMVPKVTDIMVRGGYLKA
ncbi:ABC transporter substrate-binding protein [Amphibiibacter pelophylacis]|uniref:Extracellular solute-binding protein n=1 Tax=Amphibiibacter pelophylacis TaxID=1799477 RepID=A0ACC6P4N9_9BURK